MSVTPRKSEGRWALQVKDHTTRLTCYCVVIAMDRLRLWRCVDPDAEIVALSPRALLESERYVCAICNQGFQRDQNLQMHQRRHKVPWKLLKREASEVRKRVYVCPETTCLHHDPRHALGDLVGIKKHFRRKHSSHRQWVCDRCSKAYAVQSDYKAHLKTCGTRGHSCDCGRVFSRCGET
ncbi:hypothetical protein BHE74_00039108 [Ensete ventricosum]|uniref:Uncharacterized protein n=1 Tax=Ensete ventricosum TaxID=4639 RepID=A0A444G479_ENSVE|nr:hypothetical protein B296_00017321 [Ensete ventricosum]RWW29695.1 hypothetical protein GW17_00005770 [Ensete ventricosum]RWW54313.1 hypothetical protein BHE74_00039108 [Ensete ventricosum]RZS14930.1 hypothetical protein BHM03_00046691 [Ensete ventricosum]